MDATLQEILDAREARAEKQKALLNQHQKPLICFTMNIPGPEKMNRDVSIGFHVGCRLLEDALKCHKVLHTQYHLENTGCEAYYVVDDAPQALKRLAMDIEDIDPIGRLFDMDVLAPEGKKISRKDLGRPGRKCFICQQDAAICASTRAHGLDALQARTGFYLYVAAREWMAEYIASRAYFALNQEVSTTPKPGLVDAKSTGAHRDMNIRHFFVSANALRPFFCKFAQIGFLTRDDAPEETLQKIRPVGIEAEQAMFRATHGVNTHKGAIFSLGLLCAAAGRLAPHLWQPENLLAECAAMAKGIVSRDLAGITADTAKTVGERLYVRYGITGVRGQAKSGFPAVKDVGLPVIKQALAKGLSLNDAGSITLLHLLAATDDTNLISRSDRQTQLQVKERIGALLSKDPFPSPDTIAALDAEFTERNLSPGGSADLLALTYFLLFLH